MNDSSHLDSRAGERDIEELFQLLLNRPVNNDEYKKNLVARGVSVGDLTKQILGSAEFQKKFLLKKGISHSAEEAVDDHQYRIPKYLQISSSKVKKVLIIGSCLMNEWEDFITDFDQSIKIDRVTFNNASRLPEIDVKAATGYDFQIVQVPLRSVISEGMYFGLKYDDSGGYEKLFRAAVSNLKKSLDSILAYNRQFNLLTFVLNFLPPQQNPMGRLHSRYTLNNMVYFIEELNRELYSYCDPIVNVHVIDFDQIVSNYGKKYFQDDSILHANHGSYLYKLHASGDQARLEPLGDIQQLYTPNARKIITSVYNEAVAGFRTIQQVDSIKIAIFDLDDTLWRGVAAELDAIGSHIVEGWPLGVLEALSYLWRRGTLVALVSKNDEENIKSIWNKVYEKRFSFKNFVTAKINWLPKAKNVQEILDAVNLLPQNALFIDDNPVERASVRAAMPDIRVMDAPLAHWRRILLWSSETQHATVTDESSARTTSIQAQIKREATKASMGHEAFKESLDLSIGLAVINAPGSGKFERCFELINKTNQYNTTGRRWQLAELASALAAGTYLIAVSAEDRYTSYGIVGLAIIKTDTIEQFVMSCRVFGMEIEFAAISLVVNKIGRSGYNSARGLLQETGKNSLCLKLYKESGFSKNTEGAWAISVGLQIAVPKHIVVNESI